MADPGVNEPLTPKEVKEHLDIATTDGTHDAQIKDLITESRIEWERDTARVSSSRTVTEQFDQRAFFGDRIRLSRRPATAITSINYFDTANVDQVLATTEYDLDAPNYTVRRAFDVDWPDTVARWDAITVVYVAGELVTVSGLDAMKLLCSIKFNDLEPSAMESQMRAYEMLVAKNVRSSYP